MVYDCFIFFNELDLLEIRLNELNNVVDKFVIIEANKTFQNNHKPYYFEENKAKNNQNNEEMTIDDEDELLYGSCITEISFNNIINSESSKTTLNLFSNENESIKETEMETEEPEETTESKSKPSKLSR
jgi:hypothetical protein